PPAPAPPVTLGARRGARESAWRERITASIEPEQESCSAAKRQSMRAGREDGHPGRVSRRRDEVRLGTGRHGDGDPELLPVTRPGDVDVATHGREDPARVVEVGDLRRDAEAAEAVLQREDAEDLARELVDGGRGEPVTQTRGRFVALPERRRAALEHAPVALPDEAEHEVESPGPAERPVDEVGEEGVGEDAGR